MASSIDLNQSVAMTEYQLEQLLEAMTAGMNLVKPASTFAITPGQASIGKLIDYSTVTVIIFWQESTECLPIKFNSTGG